MKFKTLYKTLNDTKYEYTIWDKNGNYVDSFHINYCKATESREGILRMLKLKDAGAEVRWVSVNRATGELSIDLVVE